MSFILHRFTIVGAKTYDDEPDSFWSMNKDNSQNTYRIVPSMATNYSKLPWTYEYNLTSQDVTQFGQGVGINGDLYFFLSEIRSHPGQSLFTSFHPSRTVFVSTKFIKKNEIRLTNMFVHLADFMICLTPNGIVRWKLFIEPVADMEPINKDFSSILSLGQVMKFIQQKSVKSHMLKHHILFNNVS
jgi:hypothetical protein